MEKNSKKKKASMQRKVLMAVNATLSVVLVLLIVVLIFLIQGDTHENVVPNATEDSTPVELSNMKELLVERVTKHEDAMIVETTYGTVKYPYAFSDLINVEAKTFKDYAVLEFSAAIDDTDYKLYTLFFNGEADMPIGKILVDGKTYAVTAQFHDVSGISDDDMVTFYAAQETFNDVVNSLSANEGFTAQD